MKEKKTKTLPKDKNSEDQKEQPKRSARQKHRWKKPLIWTILALFVAGICTFAVFQMIVITIGRADRLQVQPVQSAAQNLTNAMPADGQADVILVLGCGVGRDGKPTLMLAGRLDAALAAYQSGFAPKILVSGSTRPQDGYDEPGCMKAYLMEQGVPADAIVTDDLGLNTYASMKRAKQVLGYNSAVVVTTDYHLDRSLYLAKGVGLKAVGVSAPDKKAYHMFYNQLRESLARCKAVLTLLLD